jgi:hypothetical protein
MLNFYHGINDEKIHNVFAYYNYKKHLKSQILKKELHFLISYDVMSNYICGRKVCHDVLKKCKILHKQLK